MMFGDDILYIMGDGARLIFGLDIGDLMGDNLGGVDGLRSRTAGESCLVGEDCRLGDGVSSSLVGEVRLCSDGDETSCRVGEDGRLPGDGALLRGEVALAVGEGILIGEDIGGLMIRIGLLGDSANASNI